MTAPAPAGLESLAAIRELAQLPQWVLWHHDVRDGKPTKVPYTPAGAHAKVNDPTTWSSFADCVDALGSGHFDGLGFVFSENDPYIGIDLDKCIGEDGRPNDLAVEWVSRLNSYTERSPRGRGLHLIVKGTLPHAFKRDELGVEVYDRRRFFTMTGDWWPDAPETIEERSAELAELLERLERPREKTRPNGAGEDGEKIREPGRHNALVRRGAWLRERGVAGVEMLGALRAWNLAYCEPPLPDDELRQIAEHYSRSARESQPRPDSVAALGLDLAAIRGRERGTSPLPELLPDDPTLVVLVGRPKVAKSRLAFSLALAAAAKASPWPDADPLDLGLAAIIEAEEPAADTVRTLDQLALMGKLPRWESGLRLFARDPLLDERAAPLFRLDADGLGLVRSLAAECGLLVLDSLSRLKPPAIEERDNDGMTALLDALQRIAAEESCYLIMLHHEGHADRDDPVSAGRGASAISAVARVVWRLDRVPGEPRWRRLRVRGNAVADAELTLEVASEGAKPEGAVFYFHPVDELGAVALEDVLPEVGAECTTSDLARAIAGCVEGERPGGRAERQAKELRERWRSDGLIEVLKGARGALLLRRIR